MSNILLKGIAPALITPFDKDGNVLRKDIFPSVINSNIKMNYETVNNILYDRYNDIDFHLFRQKTLI